jgi:drug/metabolite transporter (DMT)-like permease
LVDSPGQAPGLAAVFEDDLTSEPAVKNGGHFPLRSGSSGEHSMKTPTTPKTSRGTTMAAFGAIYLVWGSTYLAIRVVVQTLPPFLAGACRFLVAGLLLAGFLWWRGVSLPTRSQWHHAAVTGVLLLLGGNGLVMWAERTIPSGLTALLIALTPIWFALLDWLRPGGARPLPRSVFGIVVGFGGVVLLVMARGTGIHLPAHWPGVLALIGAGMCWASGSLYSKYKPNDASPWMNSAAQMICGGAGLFLAGIVFGEPFTTDWSRMSALSVAALGYLIVFGSLIGFSAYVYLLKVSTPSRVSTYAYINPTIAVFLGWALVDEIVTPQMLWGTLVILAGVIIITVSPAQLATPVIQGARRQLARLVALL